MPDVAVKPRIVGLMMMFLLLVQFGSIGQDAVQHIAPLERFVGTWEKKWTIFKSEYVPDELVRTGTHTCNWVLDKTHLQETGSDSDGNNYISFYSYDAPSNKFQLSAFRSDGQVLDFAGDWDVKTNSLQLRRDEKDGNRTEVSFKFINHDEFKMSVVVKGDKDKVYFRMEGTGKRLLEKDKKLPK